MNNSKASPPKARNALKETKTFIPAEKRTSLLFIIIAFCVPVLLYLQTLSFGFTFADDDRIILNNINFLSNFGNALHSFLTDALLVNSTSFYRPLQTLSFMIDIQLSGVNQTWMFHLTNVLLIGSISSLLFLLLRRFSIPRNLALLAALIYCVHPLFVSSIAWIPARGDLMLAFFSLLSFLFFIELLQKGKMIYLFLNWAAFTMALFCKETAAFLPFIFIMYLLLFYPAKRFEIKYLFNILLIGFSGMFWYGMRTKAVGNFMYRDGMVGIKPLLHNLRIIPESLAKFFFPYDINPLPMYSLIKTLIGLAIVAAIIIIFYKRKKLKKENLFFLFWFLILMLPPMVFKNLYVDYFDHRFFLPLIGILLFVLFALPRKWFINGNSKRLWIMVAVIILLCSFTFIKSRNYSDPMTFNNIAIAQNPNSAIIYNDRGWAKENMGDTLGAIRDFDKAIAIDPNCGDAYNNRGWLKRIKHDYRGAIADFNKAIAIYPDFQKAFINREIARRALGDNTTEKPSGNIAIAPNDALALNSRGWAKENKGDTLGAIEDFNKAIAIDPNCADAFNNLGYLEMLRNDFKGAIAYLDKAITIRPIYGNGKAYTNRGFAKLSMGDKPGAIADYTKAIEINPNYAGYYFNRATAKYASKDFAGALEDCEKALKLDPNYKDVLNLKIQIQQELQKINH